MQLCTVTLLQDMNQAARPAFFEKDEEKKKELYDKGHGVLLTNSQYLTPHLFSAAPASSFGDSGGAERGSTSNLLLLFTLPPAAPSAPPGAPKEVASGAKETAPTVCSSLCLYVNKIHCIYIHPF